MNLHRTKCHVWLVNIAKSMQRRFLKCIFEVHFCTCTVLSFLLLLAKFHVFWASCLQICMRCHWHCEYHQNVHNVHQFGVYPITTAFPVEEIQVVELYPFSVYHEQSWRIASICMGCHQQYSLSKHVTMTCTGSLDSTLLSNAPVLHSSFWKLGVPCSCKLYLARYP